MGWIKDAIGYSSAGTLGFIVGGVPGAFAGITGYETIKDANYTWESMRQSGKRRRASTGSVGGSTLGKRTPKKRRTRTGFKRTGKVQVALSYAKGSGSSNNLASASRKIGYVRRYGKRPVKVSNWLRQKIKKVIETDKLVGRYTHVSYFQITPGKPFAGGTDDMQSYEYAGILTETAAHTNRLLFSPMWVNYAVSRLVNPNQVTKAMGQPIKYTDFTTDKKFLLLENTRIKVISQSATYRIRNNSGRVVTLKIYCLQPKTQSQKNPIVGPTPLDVWNSGLDLQDNAPVYKFENPLSVRMETLYANPKQVSQFRNFYKVEETIVTLDPGKEYLYKVVGPAISYDYAKFWINNEFVDFQKFTKQVMFIAYNDLVRTTTGLTGRYTDHTNGDPSSILIEQTNFIKFAIPEQVGFGIGDTFTTGENQTLNQKRNVFGIDVHQGAQTGIIEYVGDENPIDEANSSVV